MRSDAQGPRRVCRIWVRRPLTLTMLSFLQELCRLATDQFGAGIQEGLFHIESNRGVGMEDFGFRVY